MPKKIDYSNLTVVEDDHSRASLTCEDSARAHTACKIIRRRLNKVAVVVDYEVHSYGEKATVTRKDGLPIPDKDLKIMQGNVPRKPYTSVDYSGLTRMPRESNKACLMCDSDKIAEAACIIIRNRLNKAALFDYEVHQSGKNATVTRKDGLPIPEKDLNIMKERGAIKTSASIDYSGLTRMTEEPNKACLMCEGSKRAKTAYKGIKYRLQSKNLLEYTLRCEGNTIIVTRTNGDPISEAHLNIMRGLAYAHHIPPIPDLPQPLPVTGSAGAADGVPAAPLIDTRPRPTSPVIGGGAGELSHTPFVITLPYPTTTFPSAASRYTTEPGLSSYNLNTVLLGKEGDDLFVGGEGTVEDSGQPPAPVAIIRPHSSSRISDPVVAAVVQEINWEDLEDNQTQPPQKKPRQTDGGPSAGIPASLALSPKSFAAIAAAAERSGRSR